MSGQSVAPSFVRRWSGPDLEKLGWVFDVRWTNPARLARITATTDQAPPRDTPNDAAHEE